MDQNWNNQNGAPGGMPAPNMNQGQPMGGPQPTPQQLAPQQMMPAPNMNMGGSAPVVAQPGVAAIPVPQEKAGHSSLMETVILVIVCLIAAAAIVFAVIFFMRWNELKVNQDSAIEMAVSEERVKQEEIANQRVEEAKKVPKLEWVGPEVYGRLSFNYPKNWSVYVNKDGEKGTDYEVYFNPGRINSINDNSSRYTLRFKIVNRQYDVVTKEYQSKVASGAMTFQAVEEDGLSGGRFDGEISKDIVGSVVVLKMYDKSVVFQTDISSAENDKDFREIYESLRRNN